MLFADEKIHFKENVKYILTPNSYLREHPNIKTNGVLVSSGSLGHGLSYVAGVALADKINKKKIIMY